MRIEPQPNSSQQKIRWLFFIAFLIFTTTLIASYCVYLKIGVANISTPEARVLGVAKSLANNFSFQSEDLLQMKSLVLAEAIKTRNPHYQDVFSLRQDGTLFPKHSPISAIFAAPFYFMFGDLGFIIFQSLTFIVISCSLLYIINELFEFDPHIPTLLLLFLIIGTQTLIAIDCYRFTYDLHAALFLILGIALTKRWSVWGPLVASLSLLVRPTFMMLLPISLLAWKPLSKEEFYKRCLGHILGLFIYLTFNFIIFGDPFTSTYHRIPIVLPDGSLQIYPHEIGLSWEIFRSDWYGKLVSPNVGLITLNLSLLLLPFAIPWALKTKERWYVIVVTSFSLLYTLYIFSYQYWSYSFMGNRFLYVPIFLMLTISVPYLSRRKWLLRFTSSKN